MLCRCLVNDPHWLCSFGRHLALKTIVEGEFSALLQAVVQRKQVCVCVGGGVCVSGAGGHRIAINPVIRLQ